MPELPEVETICRGLTSLVGQKINEIVIRNHDLRYPVPARLKSELPGQHIREIYRRGKYIVCRCDRGSLIIHLGMSGKLFLAEPKTALQKHDHIDVSFSRALLRYNDPRRFGCWVWFRGNPETSTLLRDLGPEPFADEFNAEYLYRTSRHRRTTIKQFLMDNHVVVGVGNIYASETLFRSGIKPTRAAGTLSKKNCELLGKIIPQLLQEAIKNGGTTFNSYRNVKDRPGKFQKLLQVYDRAGDPCYKCRSKIEQITLGQRSTYFCPQCQT